MVFYHVYLLEIRAGIVLSEEGGYRLGTVIAL